MSIISNTAALSALREVNSVNRALEDNAERIATSRRINSADDGAAIWSVATRMEQDNRISGVVRDALGVAEASLTAAQTGLDAAADALQNIRDALISASASGADRTTLQGDIDAEIAALEAIGESTTVNGVEILDVAASGSYAPVKSFMASVNIDASGTSVLSIDVDLRGLALKNANADEGILEESRTVGSATSDILSIDVSAFGDSAAELQEIQDLAAIVDLALADVTAASARLGVSVDRVADQTSFIEAMETARSQAVSRLVDANLEEEAAAKDALVVRQQLAIEALAISNASLSSVLRLFD